MYIYIYTYIYIYVCVYVCVYILPKRFAHVTENTSINIVNPLNHISVTTHCGQSEHDARTQARNHVTIHT